MVQRGHHFAIVDEVDCILIDEARTPLIISGPAEESTDLYYEVDRIIPKLKKGEVHQGQVKAEDRDRLEASGDYIVDEKHKTVTLTEAGMAHGRAAARASPRSRAASTTRPTCRCSTTSSRGCARTSHYQRDVEYMIKDGQVVIVDEFTGRLMPGRRWSDGLHQAVEAKEGVKIERENQTLATITFQNYFRMYKKLSGMTGTAETEAPEFAKIYKLDVIVIPTNRPMRRVEEPDLVYRTEDEKWNAIVEDIIEQQNDGPAGAGRHRLDREVRAAVEHAQEARRQARRAEREVPRAGSRDRRPGRPQGRRHHRHQHGRPRHRHPARRQRRVHGAPAGDRRGRRREAAEGRGEVRRRRGVRLLLPWSTVLPRASAPTGSASSVTSSGSRDDEHEEVVALGGLHIVGTERHEARRIDNQLRGRAGRQGDPGSSRFYLSLEDDLMRIFGSDRISGLMQRLGMEEGVPIEHGMVTRAIERAQKQVEAQNFAVRKHLLEYDDVMNKQRESVYTLRREILEGKIHLDRGRGRRHARLRAWRPPRSCSTTRSTSSRARTSTPTSGTSTRSSASSTQLFALERRRLRRRSVRRARHRRAARRALGARRRPSTTEKEQIVPADIMRRVERDLMLQIVDAQWKDHLYSLDHLKEGIGLRGYGQRDPLVEYKKESFQLFQDMRARIEEEIVRYLWWLRPVVDEARTRRRRARAQPRRRRARRAQLQRPERVAGQLARRARTAAPAAVAWRLAAARRGRRASAATTRRSRP